MRFAISRHSNSDLLGGQPVAANLDHEPLPEYPAPLFGKSTPEVYEQATQKPHDEAGQVQLLRELQNDLATAYAQAVVIKWTGLPESKLTYVEIPSRVWRDLDDLSDSTLPANGYIENEFPKGFENGQLVMRGSVLFFGVRFSRELSLASPIQVRTRHKKYDWPSFEAEAKRLILDEGGFQPGWTQANCESAMTEWCDTNWPETPTESSIRTHIKLAEKSYLAEYRGQSA
jgi:hypothetical protein